MLLEMKWEEDGAGLTLPGGLRSGKSEAWFWGEGWKMGGRVGAGRGEGRDGCSRVAVVMAVASADTAGGRGHEMRPSPTLPASVQAWC